VLLGLCWNLSVRRKHQVGIPKGVKTFVFKWWSEITRVSPNMKDVIWKRIESEEFDEKPTYYLMESQICAFLFMLLS